MKTIVVVDTAPVLRGKSYSRNGQESVLTDKYPTEYVEIYHGTGRIKRVLIK